MYLVGVGAVSTLWMPFGCGARRGGTSQLDEFEVIRRDTASFNGTNKGCTGSAGSVDMHKYGLVAAEDGNDLASMCGDE
jgi:hypothetical protein